MDGLQTLACAALEELLQTELFTFSAVVSAVLSGVCNCGRVISVHVVGQRTLQLAIILSAAKNLGSNSWSDSPTERERDIHEANAA